MICAAHVTGKGSSAIATIQVFGKHGQARLNCIFKPAGSSPVAGIPGRVLLGCIVDGDTPVDQVTIGCEGPDLFTVHCHGNPQIVEAIMALLQAQGVTLLEADAFYEIYFRSQGLNSLQIEARLVQRFLRTEAAVHMIAHQMEDGLLSRVHTWRQDLDTLSLTVLHQDCGMIMQNSRTVFYIVHGCTAVLAGPPNSGKSTLLNALTGRGRAIVAQHRGTTRDWIEASCCLETICLTLIDTAGWDRTPNESARAVDGLARRKTRDALDRADLVLLVVDGHERDCALDGEFMDRLQTIPVLTVLNKADLTPSLRWDDLPVHLSEGVRISAAQGTGLPSLVRAIQVRLGTLDCDLQAPACFTLRQRRLVQRLAKADTKPQAGQLIDELLSGPLGALPSAEIGCR